MGSWRTTWIAGLALTLALSGCGPEEPTGDDGDDTGTSAPTVPLPTPTTPTTPTTQVSALPGHTTSDEECPAGLAGLTIRTDTVEQLPYLEQFAACTDDAESRMWIRNNSDAVWVISRPDGSTIPDFKGALRSISYASALGDAGLLPEPSTSTVFAPGDKIMIEAAPAEVSWELSAPYNVAWQAHDVAADELESWGADYLEKSLRRRTPGGKALATCTISGFQIGRTVANLETPSDLAEAQELMTDALGIGLEANDCRRASGTVKSQVAAGTLSDDLARQLDDPDVLKGIHTRMTWWQRGLRLTSAISPRW